jgi:orotidine-5'-phosphate decarboxylase
MLRRAIEAAHEMRGAPALIGVTVLTSLDEGDLETVGQNGPIADQVLRLAELAQIGGLGGVVCSAHEIGPLRARSGPGFRLVVPGIRPEGGSAGDQKRVLGPAAAVARGADILVVGRPITAADDPAAAAAAIRAEMTGETVVV